MGDGEVYFNVLNSTSYNNWNEFFQAEATDGVRTRDNLDQNVHLLPRKYASLFGIIPKMEKRSFTICNECKHIFHPKDILLHKNCMSGIPHAEKKAKNKTSDLKTVIKSSKNKKSNEDDLRIIDPILKGKDPLKISKSNDIPTKTLGSVLYVQPDKSKPKDGKSHKVLIKTNGSDNLKVKAGTSNDKSTNNSSPHKRQSSSNSISSSKSSPSKSKKRDNNRSPSKEFNLDTHCAVCDGKEPCSKPITCSIHSLQDKEKVQGRSKTVQELISEKNKDQLEKKAVNFRVNIALGQGQDKLLAKENEHKLPSPTRAAYITNGPEVENSKYHLIQGRHPNSILKTNLLPGQLNKTDSSSDGQNVIYLPMSPPVINTISLSSSPVQVVQQHNSILRVQPSNEPTMMFARPIYLALPNIPTVKLYKTHLTAKNVHSYKAKKLRGAIMINARKLENQRKDILKALEFPTKNAGVADQLQSHLTT